MPKILYDGRIFQMQKAGGINRYFAEIIAGLPEDWKPVITGVREFGANVPVNPKLRVKLAPHLLPRRFQRRLDEIWCRVGNVRRADLLHPTYYDLTSGMKLAEFQCPVVVTVYDMIYARFPGQMIHAEAIIQNQRQAVQRANRVICISKSTERDLLELMPEAAGKTTVVHLASSLSSADQAKNDAVFGQPKFLFVGARAGYKNFLFLLRAFAKAATVRPEIRLVLAGAPLTMEERWQMYYLGISEKVSLVEYPDETAMRDLYRSSVALLYPSRYEGFGIPPLEAMACGTVAVTANTSSLPEVVGDGGIMIDPADEQMWVDWIIKLAQPFSGRVELVARGRRQAAQFSWSECVGKHIEIYRKCLGE